MKSSLADLLAALARERFDPFRDDVGEAWAWDGTEAFRIGSSGFADRLSRDFYDATGRVPSEAALSEATRNVRGVARWSGPEIPVGLRVAGDRRRVVIDLG